MNTEWLNTNRYRSYPFCEDSKLNGLPNWCLCDFYLVDTTDTESPADVFLVSASPITDGIRLTLSYRDVEFYIDTTSDYMVYNATVDVETPDGVQKPIAHCVTGFGDVGITEAIVYTDRPKILPTRIIRIPGGSGVSSITVSEDVEPLPYDAEVEYLESTGTQYIDTGVVLDNDSSVALDYKLTATAQSRVGLFGGLANVGITASRYGSLVSPGAGHKVECGYGLNNASLQYADQDLLRHVINQQKNNYYVDGALVTSFNAATFTVETAPLLNFAYINYSPPRAKLFWSKWWQGAALVRDFVPVRVGSGASAVGYLYDRANPTGGPLGNGLYGNAADGQGGVTGFPLECLGPDKEQQPIGTGATETSATGRIHLGTGCNCALRIYSDTLNVDASYGEGRGKCCEQDSDDMCSSKLLFINGQTADSNGNITLSGSSGISIYPGEETAYRIPGLSSQPVILPTIILSSTDLLKQ